MDDTQKIIQQLETELVAMKRDIRQLKKLLVIAALVFPNDGTGKLVLPAGAGLPASPTNGQIAYDTSDHKFKVRENGAWKTITTS